MANKTILVKSDYTLGDSIGPFRDATSLDSIVDGNGINIPSLNLTTKRYYLDGTSGNDSNDGLSATTAKKTFNGISSILPTTTYSEIVIHVAGTVTLSSNAYLSIKAFANVVIDGGTTTTVLAGPIASADIHSTSSIGKTGLGYTVDSYAGYIIEITSGVCSGQKRTILSNTSTTITPNKFFSEDPGTATFQISKPSTIINGTGTLYLQNSGTTTYPSGLILQRVSVGGSVSIQPISSTGSVFLTGMVLESSNAAPINASYCTETGTVNAIVLDTTAFPLTIEIANWMNGVGIRTGSFGVRDSSTIWITGGYLTGVSLSRVRDLEVYNGNRIKGTTHGLILQTCNNTLMVNTPSQYSPIQFSGVAGYGISSSLSNISISDGISCADSSGHGIYLSENSYLRVNAPTVPLSGSGNGGWGTYCDVTSKILISATGTPTLAGTLGQITTVSSGSTWLGIINGSVLSDTGSMSLVRKWA